MEIIRSQIASSNLFWLPARCLKKASRSAEWWIGDLEIPYRLNYMWLEITEQA